MGNSVIKFVLQDGTPGLKNVGAAKILPQAE